MVTNGDYKRVFLSPSFCYQNFLYVCFFVVVVFIKDHTWSGLRQPVTRRSQCMYRKIAGVTNESAAKMHRLFAHYNLNPAVFPR